MNEYTGRPQRSAEEIRVFLKQHEITSIRLGFTDVLGIQRGKMIPVSHLDMLLKETGSFGCTAAILTVGYDEELVDVSFLPEKCDDMEFVPDFSTLEALPYEPHIAFVHCDVLYRGKPLMASPRSFLKWVVDQYHQLGLEPICACEEEFYAYKKDASGRRVLYSDKPSSCYCVSRDVDPDGLIQRIYESMRQMDYGLLCWNREFAPGQFEFNWKHSRAVDAADKGALFKSICKDIAVQEKAEICFMGKPAGTNVGSGNHFHISLADRKTGQNLCGDPGGTNVLSELARHMAGGILMHSCAITAFLSPMVNCYKRYQLGAYAPVYVAWGMDNRTSCLRVPNVHGSDARLEMRAASAACNPYLALGALLLAGLDGIKRRTEPPEMVDENIYKRPEVQVRLERLPESLGDALKKLQSDSWAKEAFPPELMELFLALKEAEYARYMAAVTDWEMDAYFTQA